MNRRRLRLDALSVESFRTAADPHAVPGAGDGGECVCDDPPCICTKGPDCTGPVTA